MCFFLMLGCGSWVLQKIRFYYFGYETGEIDFKFSKSRANGTVDIQ